MLAVIFSSGRFPTQAQAQSTAAGALRGARSADDSGRSGRDTERSSQNSLISMLCSTTLTPRDTKVLEEKILKLEVKNKILSSNKGCFAGWNASTIEKNQEKINQINSALGNPESVKIEFKQASFSVGFSHLKKHEMHRSMYLVNGNQDYLGLNRVGLTAFQAELLNFRKEINKEKEKYQDSTFRGESQKIEKLKTFQNKFDNFLNNIPVDGSQKELKSTYSQKFNELKENFKEIQNQFSM